MNDQTLKLENQLCFAVYACSKEITSMYRPLLTKLDLTFPQYLVMLVLWEHKEISVKELGAQLFLDSGTLTPMLKRMETGGLVTRLRSEMDERIVMIRLTEKGYSLKGEAACIPEEVAPRFGISTEEYIKLLKQLHHITQTLQKGD
ncbi:MarR family winged helix-turn-helix transcriptional regulator [Priestia koreensis]|uniref:MarR family winged helix-turn-helix transcriptional regulator n=1 Tax=Priestia koreensis TaxID=284581 RepID=UPI0034595FD8